MKVGLQWFLGILALLVALCFLADLPHRCGRHEAYTTVWWTRGFCRSAERPAASCLKSLTSAEADFRANDRDADGKSQFWRGDVAGLYTLVPPGGPAIKLIELSIAAADDRPISDVSPYAVRSQKGGYWYRAIRHADEDPKALDPDRFAFCAFPDNPSAGKYLFIVDENNTLFRTLAAGRRGIEVFPTPEELRTQWAKLD
jgi:hypothetical protein